MNQIVIPAGFTIFPGTCQCGRILIVVDDLEGLTIYGCTEKCGRDHNCQSRTIKLS